MIWRHALPEGRVIEVLWNEEKQRIYTDITQPVLLQVGSSSYCQYTTLYLVVSLMLKANSLFTGLQRVSSGDAEGV